MSSYQPHGYSAHRRRDREPDPLVARHAHRSSRHPASRV